MKLPSTQLTGNRGETLAQLSFEKLDFIVRPQHKGDVGIDLHAELIENERPSGSLLALQVKAGESFFAETDGDHFIYRPDSSHVNYWLDHSLPVVVCLSDLATLQVYWQWVNEETAVSTGKGFKIAVPISQKVDQQSKHQLRQILTPALPTSHYTVWQDNEHRIGPIKRASVKALINGTRNKAEIATVIRRITGQRAMDGYCYDATVAGDDSAHVVWTYIYLTAEDFANGNDYCASLWVHDQVDDRFKPMPLYGENVGHGITVRWNSSYADVARLTASSLTKKQYLAHAEAIITGIQTITESLDQRLEALSASTIDEGEFLAKTSTDRASIERIEALVREMPPPPYECSDLDQLVNLLAANLSNIALIYSERGTSIWSPEQRVHLAVDQIRSAKKTMPRFNYELRRLR